MPRSVPGRMAAAALAIAATPATAMAAGCEPGVYGTGADRLVVIGPVLNPPATGQRWLLPDGRRGATGDAGSPFTCANGTVAAATPDGRSDTWPRAATRETATAFESAGTVLAGRLIEPAGPADARRPLVVMVHGSEKTAAIGSVYAYMLAAQGVSAFVYDKRGTGRSGGEYTQNFELLADDAAAALAAARRIAAGRFGRAGFFGGSQGGWVAPLAATRAPADFVAVAFGLVASPIEEDRQQLLDEARRMGLAPDDMRMVGRLSDATAAVLRSHFTRGFEELAAVRAAIGGAPWARTIRGEHSGDMLRTADADLRRIGRARFDNLELIWDHDAEAVLRRVEAPVLWILAGADREAPVAGTRAVLERLASGGRRVDTYLFPGTDHGMAEFTEAPDGTRTATRIADGYLRLLADWVKGDVRGRYGRAQRLGKQPDRGAGRR